MHFEVGQCVDVVFLHADVCAGSDNDANDDVK